MAQMTRRDLMRAAVAAGVGAAITSVPRIARADELAVPPAKPGALRVAHLTDMHVTDKDRGDQGYALALRSVEKYQPAFILTGGDHVMDASGQEKRQAVAWYDTYDKVLAGNTRLPVYPCIGNHDVYGWTVKQPPTADVEFGKAMALDRLKLKQRYYSFDRSGWHFVILDNIMRREPVYYGDLDAEQAEWLKADLAASTLPKVVVTHIPLLSITSMFDSGKKSDGNDYRTSDANMHHNVRPLLKLLSQHNVKLCLSGHMHQVDDVDYLGIKFCCNGAVSGNWWKGPHLEFPEGYGIVDLHADGTVENRYVTFGWNAKA
jgi:3',5'-cyclic AMP phosphodiesterase CpdA